MTDEVKPAMDAESWASPFSFDRGSCGEVDNDMVCVTPSGERWVIKARHAHAAIALHGQPFGFTRQMVEALKRLAHSDLYDESADDGDGRIDEWCSSEREIDRAHLWAVAQRIESLLPPEDPNA